MQAPERCPTTESSSEDRPIERVAVLGANGAMGYGAAALFTSAVPEVVFLARTEDKARRGLEAAIRLVRSATVADRARVGSYDADFESTISKADLIFEAVAEDLELKHDFFGRVDAIRREDSVVASVTSGLSINALAAPRSESFRRHFVGLHLFNPPNVIVGTELVAGGDTDPRLVDRVERFCARDLGRVVVRTKDTPGFAGNRVGFKVLNEVARLAEERGPVLMDRLVGPYTGRALPPLATVDLVGWDVHRAIVDNIHRNAPDEAHATLELPGYMARLMDEGTLGNKSGKGFYRSDGATTLALEPKAGAYVPVSEVELPPLDFIHEVARRHAIGDYRGGMAAFLSARGDHAALAKKVVAGYVSYAFHRVGEVTESIEEIDRIMGFGFNWAPPGVLVDTIGLRAIVEMIDTAGVKVPPVLAEELARGRTAPFFRDPRVNSGRFFVAG